MEAPIGDFFGLGLGYYNPWQSEMLSVGSEKDLNCFFPMPFQRHARITVTNEGQAADQGALLQHRLPDRGAPLRAGHVVFPRAISPGATQPRLDNNWTRNGEPLVNKKANLTGRIITCGWMPRAPASMPA